MNLMSQGLMQAAGKVALETMRRSGPTVELLLLLAMISDQLGDTTAGLGFIEQCLKRGPNNLSAIGLNIHLLNRQGRSDEALAACETGLAIDPDNEHLLLQKVATLEQTHALDRALQTLQPMLASPQISPPVAGAAARVMSSLGRIDESLTWANRAIEDPSSTPEVRRTNWMHIAKVHDKMGRHDQAIEATLKGHEGWPKTFDPAKFKTHVDGLIATFSRGNLRMLARGSDKSEAPVFLIGMPRAGISLVEQIIASHPQAFGAGEIPDIVALSRSVNAVTSSMYTYPDAVTDITPPIASRLGTHYLQRLKVLGGSATRVTNKMPEQYEHAGLIWMLLPGARIIHVRRDPLDNCLSCFTRNLNPLTTPYVTNLEHLGFVYLEHERLMEHWKSVLDLPILTVQYEELVVDQERITRQMIEFLGLPWDDRCLRFWDSKRTVMTMSYDQVNKPMYDSSIGRWRNYEKHLGPLKEALGIG